MYRNKSEGSMRVYRDVESGFWIQDGGSRFGFPDEIDSFVERETPMKRSTRRIAIRDCLVPKDLLIQLPPEEMRGLDFLLNVLTCAKDLRVSNRGSGKIFARLTSEVDVEILAESMIRDRLGAHPGVMGPSPLFDPHLLCYLQDTSRYRDLEEGMMLCIRAPHQDGRSEYFASNNGTESVTWDSRSILPVTDILASWVMWADCGFPSPPKSFSRAVEEFELLLPELSRKQQNSLYEDEFGDFEEFLMFEEAWSWEYSLERKNAARTNARTTCNRVSRRRRDG